MADTLPNIVLPSHVWVNLYAETGIPVGTQILTQNISTCDVRLYSGAAQPGQGQNHMYQLLQNGQFARNDQGDAGAFAMCVGGGGVNVRLPPVTT